MKKLHWFLLMLVVGCACDVSAQNVPNKSATQLCKNIKKIKELPRDWGEKGVDKTYDEIVAAGESVIPCLIDNIPNTKVMRDPRCPTISKATTIGDVSYFVLVDMLKLEFTELLPNDVKSDFKTHGVYAYHEYIDKPGARNELQTKLRHYYSELKGNKLN
jgi:hypothetical protein